MFLVPCSSGCSSLLNLEVLAKGLVPRKEMSGSWYNLYSWLRNEHFEFIVLFLTSEMLQLAVYHAEGLEGSYSYEERKERRSDVENSEDERRKTRIGSLKKKALNASSRFTHSLKKRGRRRVDFRVPSVPIEDVRDAEEEQAVSSFRQQLIAKDLLPNKHDDYHTLLRLE